MRSSLSVSSSGNRVPASQRSMVRNNWSASAGNSRMPDCASQRWSDASMNLKASLPRPSSRWFSRMRRWAAWMNCVQLLEALVALTCWSRSCSLIPLEKNRGNTSKMICVYRWMKVIARTQTCRFSVCLVATLSIQKWHWDIWRDVMQRWLFFLHFLSLASHIDKLLSHLDHLFLYFPLILIVWEPDFLWLHVSYKNRRVRRKISVNISFPMFSCFNLQSKTKLIPPPSRATRLFCDVYNPQSKTYCKRLQVLCPEHSRDPKVSGNTLYTAPPNIHNFKVQPERG